MDVTLDTAYAEACKALGEALVRERLLIQELARRDQEDRPGGPDQAQAPVLERDGFKVYPTPDGNYSVSYGGTWLSGCYGPTPEDALTAGRNEVQP